MTYSPWGNGSVTRGLVNFRRHMKTAGYALTTSASVSVRDGDPGCVGCWLKARVGQDIVEKNPVNMSTNLTVHI